MWTDKQFNIEKVCPGKKYLNFLYNIVMLIIIVYLYLFVFVSL